VLKASAGGWRITRKKVLLGVFALGTLVLAACNSVLGIEPARLGDADASTGAGGGAGSGGAACTALGATVCGRCVAAQCCEEYQACVDDPGCRRAVEVYDGCINRPPTDVVSSTCSEDLGTSDNIRAQALAGCMFVDLATGAPKPGKCATPCDNAPIGDDPCANYCGCMADFCQITIPADCPTACAALTPAQLHCRTYHCFLGSMTTPDIHCRHAIGQLMKCQ
jgi:hypothetical protein